MSADIPERFIVVTGLSGAGKTVVLNALEDLSYYCVDNLPVGLLPELLNELRGNDQPLYRKVAIGIDARNPPEALARFPNVMQDLRRAAVAAELVFMEASDETLLHRFSETRRRHPLSTDKRSLVPAIREERRLLGPLAEYADLRIDTTHVHVHGLRDLVRERVARRAAATLSVQLVSFGFKRGVPADADFVFDVRCLPNPYWQAPLRDLSGRDREVIEFLQAAPQVEEMVADIARFLERWIASFEASDRTYLTIGVGCTGGRHRSVYVAGRLAERIAAQDKPVLLTHRDL